MTIYRGSRIASKNPDGEIKNCKSTLLVVIEPMRRTLAFSILNKSVSHYFVCYKQLAQTNKHFGSKVSIYVYYRSLIEVQIN